MFGSVTSSPNEDGSLELNFPVPWGIIAAKAWGDPCLSPVLVVHGLQDNAGSFDRLIPLLPRTFYYVCIDMPGHGRSSRFPKGIYLDFLLYISAIRRVILHLQWSEYYYIGHSLGAQMGSYYASLYPDEVKKLVMLDTLGQLTLSLDGYVKFYQELNKRMFELEGKMIEKDPPNYTYEEALDRLISHRAFPITKEAAKALITRSIKKGKTGLYHFSTDQRLKFAVRTPMTTEQHIAIVSKIQCPVLLLITKKYLHTVENDRKNNFETASLELYRKKGNFQIISVEGDHDVHNNSPEVVAPHMVKFFLYKKSVL